MRELLRSKLWWVAVAAAVVRAIMVFRDDADTTISKVLLVVSIVLMIVIAVRFESHRRSDREASSRPGDTAERSRQDA